MLVFHEFQVKTRVLSDLGTGAALPRYKLMQAPPELPPFPNNDPDGPPTRGPGQEPEFPDRGPSEFPDPGAPSESPPGDPGFPGMPPLTD